jgi:hypothetical protein
MDTTQQNGSFQLDPTPPPVKRKKPAAPTETAAAKAARRLQEKRNATLRVNYQSVPASREEEHFRHEHWKDKRRRVLQALKASGTGHHALDAFENCGADCIVEFDKEQQRYRMSANYCHCRHCEPCMKSKSQLLAANLQKAVTDSPNGQFRFITLTLKHTEQPLGEQLDRLNQCFKRLRNSKVWKETQHGGAAMLEVKYSQDTGEWHPHLHIVAEGIFLHHRDLSAAWLAITGDSFKVDIRVIKSARDAAFYVAKYVSKGTNDAVWYTDHIAVEWVTTMRGRRSCATYGTWRGLKLLEHPTDTGEWTKIGTLNEVVRRANEGEEWAIRLIDTLKRDCQYNPHRPRRQKETLPSLVDT